MTGGQAVADRAVPVEENVETVNDLVLSQKDKPQTHRPVREISRKTEKFIGALKMQFVCIFFHIC